VQSGSESTLRNGSRIHSRALISIGLGGWNRQDYSRNLRFRPKSCWVYCEERERLRSERWQLVRRGRLRLGVLLKYSVEGATRAPRLGASVSEMEKGAAALIVDALQEKISLEKQTARSRNRIACAWSRVSRTTLGTLMLAGQNATNSRSGGIFVRGGEWLHGDTVSCPCEIRRSAYADLFAVADIELRVPRIAPEASTPPALSRTGTHGSRLYPVGAILAVSPLCGQRVISPVRRVDWFLRAFRRP